MPKSNLKPHALVDFLREKLHCVNDYEVAREIGCAPSMISKFRHRTCQVSAALMIEIHEKYDMPISQIKLLIEQANEQFTHS